MTDSELNCWIAEKLGWVKWDRVCINGTWQEVETWVHSRELSYASPEDPPKGIAAGRLPPRYSPDLNASHEMEKEIPTIYEKAEYQNHLEEICGVFGNPVWHATAKQRALAFYKTMGGGK